MLPHTTKRRITTNLKINKQSEAPENQTAWNSDNQGIKEEINQTGKADQEGQLRKTRSRQLRGGGDYGALQAALEGLT